MVGSRIVCCSVCGKELFYLGDGYKMAMKIICVDCGDRKAMKSRRGSKTIKTAAANFARTKKGIRKDIHDTYSFKSATEANVARIFKYLGIKWKYEERAFTFDGYKTKPHVYIMDFELIGRKKLPDGLEYGWIEVKGYMDARSRNKLRRFKKCWPEDAAKTTVIIYTKYKKKDIEFCEKLGYKYLFYDELTKKYSPLIDTWE
jgi:hypothetical protein